MTLIFLYPIHNAMVSVHVANLAKPSISGPNQLNHFAHICSFIAVWIMLWNWLVYNQHGFVSSYLEQGIRSSVSEEWEGVWSYITFLRDGEGMRRLRGKMPRSPEDQEGIHQVISVEAGSEGLGHLIDSLCSSFKQCQSEIMLCWSATC